MALRKRYNMYWVDFMFNSKRYRKKSPDNSYRGAIAYELLLRQKLARGEPLQAPKDIPFFKEVALEWLNVYVQNNNKPSEYINRSYILKSNLIPYFGKKRVHEITTYHIETYKTYLINKRNLSPKTVNNYLCILSRCLRSAQEWEMISALPKIKLQKVPPQKFDYLTEDEAKQLLSCAKGMWHDMILLALQTGLRFGEIIALKWEDINFEQKTLTVNRNIVRGIEGSPKNNKTRIIPLSLCVLYMLKDRPREYERIFFYKKGKVLKHDYCTDRLREICEAAGLRKIGWHSLRHSFASHLAAKQNSIVAIKDLLGHSDLKTTMRYAHVNLSVLKQTIDTLEPSYTEIVTILSQVPVRDHEFDSGTVPNLQNH